MVIVALLITIVILAAMIFVPIFIVESTYKLVENYRRKKHPDYFKIYDEALKASFEIGAEYRRRLEPIEYLFKLYTEGLREGECTSEDFDNKMKELISDYQYLCSWYRPKATYIRSLTKQADNYAREHKIKWGIIYN